MKSPQHIRKPVATGPCLRSESGQAALVFAIAFAVLSSILMLQMASTNNYVNALHSEQKSENSQRDVLQRLGMQVKQAFDRGRLDSTCGGYTRRDVDGQPFCMPADGTVCVTMPTTSTAAPPRRACLSLRMPALNLSPGPASPGAGAASNPGGDNGLGLPDRRVRLVVPPVTHRLWKSCDTGVCVNLVLCPIGETDCALDEAIATQVMLIENT